MGSFYGNIITHIPRTNFQISHTYPNAWMLKQQSIVDADNVALYNYVLVDYNHPNTSYTDKETIGLYQFNNLQDQNAYGNEKLIINYDQTVWQKVLNAEGVPYYKTICRINSILPSYPAQTHFQPKSLIEFQRLNNAPIIKEYTPISTEEFGITNCEIDSIKLDKNAVEFFNKRNSEVAGENIEIFEITMDETHPSMSVYTTHEYEEQIKTKIEELNESINELNQKLKDTQDISTVPILNTTYDNLVYYTELLTWYTEVFLPSTQTLTIEDIPYRLRYFDTDTLEYPTK